MDIISKAIINNNGKLIYKFRLTANGRCSINVIAELSPKSEYDKTDPRKLETIGMNENNKTTNPKTMIKYAAGITIKLVKIKKLGNW
jgi:hypothetical protein